MHLRGVLIEDRNGDTLLYAGDMKVRITDWFFFKKEAELKYVSLEDALIKFQRSDSVWSQQFFLDYFSSPTSETKPKKKAGIKLDLKSLELKNVTFLKKDPWLGEDMSFHVGFMGMNADTLSLSGNQYDIKELLLQDPVLAIHKYRRSKPQTPSLDSPEEKAAAWNSGQMMLKVGDIKIINGVFKSDEDNGMQPLAGFDGKHILFTAINGSWSNSSFVGDTILSKLKLSAKERSGLDVKNITADVKLTPQGMVFNHLELVTNRSTIRNYFSMSYASMADMSDFIHKVKMTGNFDGSYVDSDDLAFFAPSLRSWNKKISIKGNVRGTVDALVGRGMLVQAGNGTLLNGDISLTGLPDINHTFIDLKANDFRTTYSDAVTIIPAMRRVTDPDLRKIQFVDFQGNFTGFLRDFVAFGTIRTNLGTAKTDLNVKLPKGQEPIYSGMISTDNFRLGELLGEKKLGSVSFTATVKGRGFNANTRNTSIDANIRFADYNNYRYTNIAVNGKLEKKLFNGFASIHDEKADLTLNGTIDFNGRTPVFKLVADVVNADLRKLGITRDSIQFKGLADLNFTSDNIDNFLGSARITNAELTKNGHRLPFDSLIVESVYANNEKQLTVVSNELIAKISGDFNLQDLPNAFTYLLNKYYPTYIRAPRKYPRNQDIKFDITTYYVDEYVLLIDSNLTGFSNAHLQGNLNLAKNELNLSADVPQFKYRQYSFNDIKLSANGNADSLVVAGQANNIRINDSLSIPQALFHINARNDSSRVSLATGAKTVEKADLNALVLTYHDGVKIEFDPSTFTINGKTWTIDPNGELVLRSNTLASGLLVLSEADQRIMLKTQPSANGKWNDIKVEVTKLNIGDFSPYFLPKNRLEGLLTGNIFIEDPTGQLKITSDEIRTQYLRLDNDSLGEVRSTVYYDNQSGELKVKGNTLNQENYLGFDAHIFLNDPEKAKNNLITLNAKNFQINILERFLGNIFSEMQGYLTGDIKVSGEFNNVSVIGKGRLKDAGVRVKMTQCFYWIQDTEISLDDKKINLDGIVLMDSITRNPIYVTGGIEHQSFKNMFFNLDLSTRKPGTTGDFNNRPVQLMNTTYRDSKQFYGNVKGTASLSLAGPQSDMFMKIDAVASTEDSSYITLPPSSGRETGLADFLVERKYGQEMTASDLLVNATNITYDIDLNVTKTPLPMVSVRVILDELTGDEIKGKGYGSLNIQSGTSEPLSLRGRFNIVEGSYLFTFQSFFKKPFELRKEYDNYISWDGDPYSANINFEAVYKAERVSFRPLADLLQQVNSGASGARGDVYVVASLKDTLYKPTIQFSLDFPTTSVAVTDPELALVIQQMQKNPNEVVRQATYLIVFNSFAPSELAGNDFSVGGLGLTTISGIFLNVINDQINKLIGNLFKSDKYNIALNTSIYNRNINAGTFQLGGNINFSVGRSFFNNRFRISTGVGYDTPLDQFSGSQTFGQQLLPDVTLEWLINPSGTIRASFFYRENTDYLTSAATGGPGKAKRIGANLSYRKDFDNLGDLFRKKKKAPPVPAEPAVKNPVEPAIKNPSEPAVKNPTGN